MKTLFMVRGTMGVGKTATCAELKNLLPCAVLLDGDNLWDMHPFVVNGRTKRCVIDNICACLKSFIECPDFENIIFCWVMQMEEIADGILARLPLEGVRVVNVCLMCSPQALEERLSKDIRIGTRERDVLSRSLKYLPLYDGVSAFKVDTSKISAREAAQVIAAL